MQTTTTQTKKAQQADLKRAQELMRVFAQCSQNLKDLQATIANEVEAYKKNMKEAEAELLQIGDRNRDLFVDDNLHLEDGYLHIAHNSVVETTRKFNWTDFLEQKGDLVKFDFEKAKIKKLWMDAEKHNELIELGVQVSTEKVMQVIARKS